jgi:hypothetical protein
MHIVFANFYRLSITGPKMPADLKQCAAAFLSIQRCTIRCNAGGMFGTTCEIFGDGKWKERVLHRFTGGVDGGLPSAGFILDSAGNRYCTTSSGGTAAQGTGFEISHSTALSFFGAPIAGKEQQANAYSLTSWCVVQSVDFGIGANTTMV